LDPKGNGKIPTHQVIKNEKKVEVPDRVETPLITTLLEKHKPEVVLIEFGTNYANENGTYNTNLKNDLGKFIDEIKKSNAQCLFVGPPDVRSLRVGNQKVNEVLKSWVTKDCSYFDSQKVTSYPPIVGSSGNGDGVHYAFKRGVGIAKIWATQVAHWAQKEMTKREPATTAPQKIKK
jgi:hypothetical protein